MKRKLIAAALVLMSAGFAWHAFADKYDDCREDCQAKALQCDKDNVEGKTGADKKLAEKYCVAQLGQCIRKCAETDIDKDKERE